MNDQGSLMEFEDLRSGDVIVPAVEQTPADPARGYVPAYSCDVMRAADGVRVGSLSLRIGDGSFLTTYAGQLGYGVDPEHRGHRYAAQACRAIVPLATHHGLNPLWITVSPDNLASRRTCELLGCELVEVVELPSDCDMYREGHRHKCRYRWDLPGRSAAEVAGEMFATALDRDDWDSAISCLAPECVYHCRGSVTRGRAAIVESYRGIGIWVRATFETVRYESVVESGTADAATISFRDLLAHRGHTLDFRCRQEIRVNGEGRVIRIDHMDIPGEPEKAAEFNAACGVIRPA